MTAARRASIDRFEEDVAVLVSEDGTVRRLSKAELPASAREGDVIRLDTLEIDAAATEALKGEVAAARARARKNRAPPGDL